MSSIVELKEVRRHNVALLLDSYGQAELSKDSGISEAYLYQMSSKAKGKQQRGVNDSNARAIEAAAGLERGWLDIDRRAGKPSSIKADIKAAKIRRKQAWPFKTISRERFEALDEGDKLRVEGAMLKAMAAIEREAASPSGKRRVS